VVALALLLAGAAAAAAQARAGVPLPSPEGVTVSLFAGTRAEAAAARAGLLGMLERAAATLGGKVGAAGRVTVLPRTPGQRRVEEWEVHVELPPGVTPQQLVAALHADETCRTGRAACGERCRLVDEHAAGGHWHVTPAAGMRECLMACGAVEQGEAVTRQAQVEDVVAAGHRGLDLPRRPLVQRVRITLGRPDFEPAFGPPK
jgi:hypothetical protein